MGQGYYLFDRRWDHFQFALSSMVKKKKTLKFTDLEAQKSKPQGIRSLPHFQDLPNQFAVTE